MKIDITILNTGENNNKFFMFSLFNYILGFQDLPDACTVQCRIPNHLFGDFISVLEFLTTFKDVLSVRDFFPQGVHFDTLERALVEQEIAGQ
jgi:hypothetical protein